MQDARYLDFGKQLVQIEGETSTEESVRSGEEQT